MMKKELMKRFEDKFKMTMNPSIDPLTLAALAGGAGLAGKGLETWLGNKASRRAQGYQEGALDEAGGQFQSGYGNAMGYQQPFLQGGTQAFGQLSDLASGFNIEAPEFNFREFSPQDVLDDPGFQFRMDQGLGAVEGSAAARGGALGGRTLKELSRFGQGLASSELQNAYNRFSGERDFARGTQQQQFMNQLQAQGQQFGQLSGISQFGANAAGNLGNLETGLAGNLADLSLQRGNVQAGGTLGRAKSRNQFIGSATDVGTNLAGMFGMGGGGGGNPTDLSGWIKGSATSPPGGIY